MLDHKIEIKIFGVIKAPFNYKDHLFRHKYYFYKDQGPSHYKDAILSV